MIEIFLNGAGVFVAVSALPMLVGLLLREGAVSALLRRVAILLAVLIPVVFLALYLALPGTGHAQFDFSTNDQAARLLYGSGGNPYSIHAAYSFPFPTFYLYWLNSGFGTLSESAAWTISWFGNGAIWLVCVLVLWRTLPSIGSARGRDVRYYAAAAIPAMTTIWQGQTALLILAGLVALHQALMEPARRLTWIAGGVGLAWATLIKPQLALVGFGLLVYGLLLRTSKTPENDSRLIWILGASVAAATAMIGLTLILPGGVTLDTYRRFVSEALPQVARPDADLIIGSPAYVAGSLVPDSVDLVANGVTILMVALAVYWTFRRRDCPPTEIAAGWGVWAMVAPRVAWTWYAAWCLPFFLLALQSRPSRERTILFVLALALLNWQIGILAVAFATILLLIGLLWTSFLGKPTYV